MKLNGCRTREVMMGFGAIYIGLCIFCGLADAATIRAILGLLWILGPPANLVYGWRFLAPFVVGTLLVGGLFVALIRVKAPARRVMLGLALSAVWAFFGFLSYAPGA